MFLASFSFVGIEVVAATAPEASLVKDSVANPRSENDFENPFEVPAILVPLTATLIYTWGGWVVTQNIASCDKRLPSLAWNTPRSTSDDTGSPYTTQSDSIFVLSAGIMSPDYETAVTALLIVNLISTSSTALFVASRSLFGLATRFPKPSREQESNKHFRWISEKLAKKNQFDVPYRAVWISGWLFWVPFLRFRSPKLAIVVSCIYALSWGITTDR